MPNHVVRPGDSIAAIAAAHGHRPATLWDHPDNAELRELREDANVLCPGDRVFVPAITLKSVSVATDAQHRLRVNSVLLPIRIRLLHGEEPRADLCYRFVVHGSVREGTTDADGVLEELVPPSAQTAELTLIDLEETYEVRLGHLDPVVTESGLQARLQNLRFLLDNPSPAALEAAIENFQRAQDLPVTGRPDDATRDALLLAHGC